MLSQVDRLINEVDGRYASDDELQFFSEYVSSFGKRARVYSKIQSAEMTIVQQVYDKLRRTDPSLLKSGNSDVTAKWKRDTVRVLRYSAIAMLLNDPDSLQERFLLWFQTIMRAFGTQKSCKVTYDLMQEVVNQHLTPDEAKLFCPILEMNGRLLGAA